MKSFFGRHRSPAAESTPSAADAATPSVDELIAQGNKLEDSGNAQDALGLYERAALSDAGSWRAHLNAGNALRLLGRDRDAADAYRRALRINPDFAGGHLNLGNVLIVDPESLPAATESYRSAIRLR